MLRLTACLTRRFALALAALVASACFSDAKPLSQRAHVPPFSGLGEEVRLGMRARTLVAVSPGLEVAGYVGYRVRTPEGTLYFEFPGSWDDHQPPPGRSRLEAVEWERWYPDGTTADVAWAGHRDEIQGTLGVADLCIDAKEGSRTSRAMTWELGGSHRLSLTWLEAATDSGRVTLQLRAGELHPFLRRLREEGWTVECGAR